MKPQKPRTQAPTDKLEAARIEIDAVDREIAALFVRRMRAVESVADYKRAHGLPILDAAREEAVIRKNEAFIEDEDLRPYYVEFLNHMMATSRHYQRARLSGMRVAFSGVEGAFAWIAAKKIFPEGECVPHPDFGAAYDAVLSGDCDVAVLPIENSTAGEVGQVIDRLFSGSLAVNGVYDFSITHHLLAPAGATLADIRRVVSHPQALAQCASFIRMHGLTEEVAENTASAARDVAEAKDVHTAAIAGEETAELYGLNVLVRHINETALNTTRFAVLTRSPAVDHAKDKHSILLFTVRNEAGSLAEAINIIGEYGYNMRCLRSRPMKELLWQYYFYVELEGDLYTDEGKRMLGELTRCCDRLKVVGSFRYPATPGK